MTYRLLFLEDALKEWGKLDQPTKTQFKLRSVGYRLAYQVRDNEIAVSVVSVGKREKNAAYKAAVKRI